MSAQHRLSCLLWAQLLRWAGSLPFAQIPNQMAAFFSPLIGSPILLLLSINVFLFLIGMVMDLTPNILIFAPVFYPLIQQAGIDPYYFGLLFIPKLSLVPLEWLMGGK